MSDDPQPKLELQLSFPQTLVRRMDQQLELMERLLAEADAAHALVVPASFTNSLGMTMIWCPPGEFLMGSREDEEGREDIEDQVQVRISQGFWLASTPVTQAQWETLMGSNPSPFQDSKDLPVEWVSWDDAQDFCAKLNALEIAPAGYRYALPSEAQWEYACRAGTTSVFAFGDTLTSQQANFDGNYPYGTTTKGVYLEKTSKVASYNANAWGLYDMHGNVWEWCADAWDATTQLSGGTDPVSNAGSFRVNRGGSWNDSGLCCRSASRYWYDPGGVSYDLGFRVASVPVERSE